VEDLVGRPVSCLPEQDMNHVLSHVGDSWQDLRNRSVFLTGGTGFVGRWLLESLLWATDRLNLRVRVVVLTRDPARFRQTSPHLAAHPSVHLLQGGLLEFEFPTEQFPFVIHAATEKRLAADSERPLSTFDMDIDATRRVLEFARQHGVRRLLFTSSGAVYGTQPSELTHIPEEYTGGPSTMDSASAYGHAKRASEFMTAMYGRVYGFDATIARLFAFVGPLLPLDGQYAAGNFIRDLLRGGPLRVAGDGTPYRSYLYAADLAVWLWTILLRGRATYPYNVGSPHQLTIGDLARAIVRLGAPGTRIETAERPLPGAPPLRYVPRTVRAEHDLGLRAFIPIDQGIHQTLTWYRNGASA
jgi:dTDP-glucose 4,6-dehydratase